MGQGPRQAYPTHSGNIRGPEYLSIFVFISRKVLIISNSNSEGIKRYGQSPYLESLNHHSEATYICQFLVYPSTDMLCMYTQKYRGMWLAQLVEHMTLDP